MVPPPLRPLAWDLTLLLLVRRARVEALETPRSDPGGPSWRARESASDPAAPVDWSGLSWSKGTPWEGPRPPFTGALRKRIVSGFVLKRNPSPYVGCFLAKSSHFWRQGFIRTRPHLTLSVRDWLPWVMNFLRGSWIPKEAHRALCTDHDF